MYRAGPAKDNNDTLRGEMSTAPARLRGDTCRRRWGTEANLPEVPQGDLYVYIRREDVGG